MKAILARNTEQHRAARALAPVNPWIQTSTGQAFDLVEPTPEMIDFREIAGALARCARFNGHIASFPYSVAQHSVLGAEYFEARGMLDEARLFLLHDAHEAYLGDLATPVQWAIMAVARRDFGYDARNFIFNHIWGSLRDTIDRAIHLAAGIDFQPAAALYDKVKLVDRMLLIAERNQLMAKPPHPWAPEFENTPPLPLRGRIRALGWPEAEAQFTAALHRLFPHLRA